MITRQEIEKKDGTTFPAKSFQKSVLAPVFDIQKKYYFKAFIEMTKAHVVMLEKQDLLTKDEAKTILASMLEVEKIDFENREYDPRFEDLFFMFEKTLEEKIGPDLAGKVHTARSRNDICVAEFRMAMRDRNINVLNSILNLKDVLLTLISENFETIMPMYTHTQPAQPSTLSHYLLSMYDVLSRDYQRFLGVEKAVNKSPLGAAAITTTAYNINREYTAELLGFDCVLENSYDSISSTDHTLEFASSLMTLSINLSRFLKDLLDWCTKEFNFVYLADGYVQKSSIMPQKRNPSSLERTRPLLSRVLSQAQSAFTIMHNTPYGDIVDNEEELQEHIYLACDYVVDAMDLMANVLGTMTINKELLFSLSKQNFITVTELADTLVREAKISFRQAHSVTSRIVRELHSKNLTSDDITEDFVQKIVQDVVKVKTNITSQMIKTALDPVNFVKVRSILGGPSPKTAMGMYKNRLQNYKLQQESLNNIVKKYANATKQLDAKIQEIIKG